MSEPMLENISDYDTLKGDKKKVFWLVILAGVVIGGIYVLSYNYFGNVSDSISVEKKIGNIPVK